jgi:hypothetical protein
MGGISRFGSYLVFGLSFMHHLNDDYQSTLTREYYNSKSILTSQTCTWKWNSHLYYHCYKKKLDSNHLLIELLPFSSKWVAKLCLKVWGVTFLYIFASLASCALNTLGTCWTLETNLHHQFHQIDAWFWNKYNQSNHLYLPFSFLEKILRYLFVGTQQLY